MSVTPTTPGTTAVSQETVFVACIHGLWGGPKDWRNMAKALRSGEIHFLDVRWESSGRTRLEEAAASVATQLWQAAPRDSRVVLLGFSAGGLLARRIAYAHDPEQRISHIITLATPHGGSWLAWAKPWLPGVWDIRPGSPFLQQLDIDRATRPDIAYSSLYLPADHLVIPWSSARLAGATQVRLPLRLHSTAPLHQCIVDVAMEHIQQAVFDAEAP